MTDVNGGDRSAQKQGDQAPVEKPLTPAQKKAAALAKRKEKKSRDFLADVRAGDRPIRS